MMSLVCAAGGMLLFAGAAAQGSVGISIRCGGVHFFHFELCIRFSPTHLATLQVSAVGNGIDRCVHYRMDVAAK
jgi:hypothetical protein